MVQWCKSVAGAIGAIGAVGVVVRYEIGAMVIWVIYIVLLYMPSLTGSTASYMKITIIK